MKFVITGASGQLGFEVLNELKLKGYQEVLALSHTDWDITNIMQTEKILLDYKPDVIIHCAAWTKVDDAEENALECYKVNVTGTENIVKIAKKINAKLVYISTDYVFDGTKEGLYEITDMPNPQNVYGKTKLLGEEIIKKNLTKYFIVRISWLFGINGNNFIKTMIKQSRIRKEVDVVSDQYGSPTYAVDLAKLLLEMSFSNKYGTYHASNEGFCSWAQFAEYIFELLKTKTKVNHLTSDKYVRKAIRPMNSRFSKQALVQNDFTLLPHWQNAVERYLIKVKERKMII